MYVKPFMKNLVFYKNSDFSQKFDRIYQNLNLDSAHMET